MLLERMEGRVEVHWVRGHEDERTTPGMMSKHQKGNVIADANCTAVKKGIRIKARLLLPRRKSWRLHKRLGCGSRKMAWRGDSSKLEDGRQGTASESGNCQDGVLDVADRGCDGQEGRPLDWCRGDSGAQVCTVW